MKKQESKLSSRRVFLQQSAVAGAGAAIAASSPASALSLTEVAQKEQQSKGYRETENELAYYKSAVK